MNKSRIQKHFDFILLDLLCLILSFFVAYYFRHKNLYCFSIDIYKDMFFILISINLILCFFIEPYKDVLRRDNIEEIKKTLIYDSLSFLFSVLYLFVVKSASEFSRITLVLTYSIYFVFSLIVRNTWKSYLKKKSINSLSNGAKSLLIVCKEKDINKTIEEIVSNNYDNYYISGLCVIDNDVKGKKISNYKVVSNKEDLLKYVSTNWIDEILIAADYSKIPKNIINGLNETGIPLHIKLKDVESLDGKTQYINKIGNINVITAVNKTYSNYQLFVKRMMDIIGGIIGCIITVILIIIIGPIIYIKSPGNIFYVSDRVGKNGKVFKFYKFRSMVLNADDLKDNLKKNNRVKDGMMFKLDDDPRIIPGIGHFIRKTSIDEFPQFFNVLKNDMSLVGTRPPTIDEWNRYSPYYRSRLSIKPGITGMWQISGRSSITDFNEVVRLDNEYINKWSLSLDIKIILKTIGKIFNNDNEAM